MNSGWLLATWLALGAILRYGVVNREAYPERKFGPSYREYKAAVRR
ncbi:MAG: hypothetical protein ACRELA_08730 [Candidatus Rokuibacteriota bacterium]